jgi:hypothetical protein
LYMETRVGREKQRGKVGGGTRLYSGMAGQFKLCHAKAHENSTKKEGHTVARQGVGRGTMRGSAGGAFGISLAFENYSLLRTSAGNSGLEVLWCFAFRPPLAVPQKRIRFRLEIGSPVFKLKIDSPARGSQISRRRANKKPPPSGRADSNTKTALQKIHPEIWH